ncbi:hypothetical protein TNCV_4316561 [Trichonephila clavipes]|nr:hypothetical protein TNCV_4316561 [Trichonephila clavipes]
MIVGVTWLWNILCTDEALFRLNKQVNTHYQRRIKAWSNWVRTQGLAVMGASSRSRLSLNNIIIRIMSKVKDYFLLYSPKNWEFWTICQLNTCDDHRPRTGSPPSLLIQPKGVSWSSWYG